MMFEDDLLFINASIVDVESDKIKIRCPPIGNEAAHSKARTATHASSALICSFFFQ